MKRVTSLLIGIFLLIACALPVFAATPKVVDNADLLTDGETAALEAMAQAIADEYQMDIVILTVNSTDGRSIEAYADDYYDSHDYGIGPYYSGVLMMLAMDTREWAISTCGDTIYALTDYGLDALFDAMADDLSEGEYYRAFETYLEELPRYFDAYRNGQPIDGYREEHREPGAGDYLRIVLVSVLIGAAVGGIAILIMRGQMNTAKAQTGATSYLRDGSFLLTRHLDLYLYSRVNRSARQQSSGGGSSTHRSSSGRSHGGSHGRF